MSIYERIHAIDDNFTLVYAILLDYHLTFHYGCNLGVYERNWNALWKYKLYYCLKLSTET